MISSSIYAKDVAASYPQCIQTALAYLRENADKFAAMEPGTYEIQGRDIYAMVSDCTTKPQEQGKPEFHKNYMDVQFVAAGCERLGFTPDTGKYEVAEAFPEKDLYFYKAAENISYIDAVPGCYNIFFPSDIHFPGLACGESMTVRKVVVKVSMALL